MAAAAEVLTIRMQCLTGLIITLVVGVAGVVVAGVGRGLAGVVGRGTAEGAAVGVGLLRVMVPVVGADLEVVVAVVQVAGMAVEGMEAGAGEGRADGEAMVLDTVASALHCIALHISILGGGHLPHIHMCNLNSAQGVYIYKRDSLIYIHPLVSSLLSNSVT
jgi:hypothetical protein